MIEGFIEFPKGYFCRVYRETTRISKIVKYPMYISIMGNCYLDCLQFDLEKNSYGSKFIKITPAQITKFTHFPQKQYIREFLIALLYEYRQ